MSVDIWVIQYVKMGIRKKELSVGTMISQIGPYTYLNSVYISQFLPLKKGGYFLDLAPIICNKMIRSYGSAYNTISNKKLK